MIAAGGHSERPWVHRNIETRVLCEYSRRARKLAKVIAAAGMGAGAPMTDTDGHYEHWLDTVEQGKRWDDSKSWGRGTAAGQMRHLRRFSSALREHDADKVLTYE